MRPAGLLGAIVMAAAVVRVAHAADPSSAVDDARRWQGAWVLRDAERPGSVEAWSVRGATVRVYDAQARRSVDEDFALVSPCRATRTRHLGLGRGPGAEARTTSYTFVFAGDGLYVGPPSAPGGFQRDGRVVACIGAHVFSFDVRTGGCARWNETMSGAPESSDVECVVENGFVGRAFVVRPLGGGQSTELDFYGDALLSPALAALRAEPTASYDEAVRRAEVLLPQLRAGPRPK